MLRLLGGIFKRNFQQGGFSMKCRLFQRLSGDLPKR